VLADWLWGFPKPFTDLEMIKYWKQGRSDKVIQFTSEQIMRILALYLLYRKTSETPFSEPRPGAGASSTYSLPPTQKKDSPKLTIPGPLADTASLFKCPQCLNEYECLNCKSSQKCGICDAEMVKIR